MDSSTACIYSTFGSDPDLAELVELFVAEMPERIERLLALYDDGNLPELRRTAHHLKGASGSYGFQPLSPAASRLESTVKADRPDDQIKADLDALVDLCKRVRAGSANS
jgi:HPt (histidine-containing phosphotransfer) domain-containing protein